MKISFQNNGVYDHKKVEFYYRKTSLEIYRAFHQHFEAYIQVYLEFKPQKNTIEASVYFWDNEIGKKYRADAEFRLDASSEDIHTQVIELWQSPRL